MPIARHRTQQQNACGLKTVVLVLALVAVGELLLLLQPRHTQHSMLEMHDDARGLFGREQRRGGGSPCSTRQQAQASGFSTSRHRATGTPPDLQSLRGSRLLFVTFGNKAFSEFVSNWVASVQRLQLPFLVGALDSGMADVAQDQGWPFLDVSALVQGNSSMFRANFKAFRNMGATKVQLVLTLLEELGVDTVVVSDSDTSWLGDPSAHLNSYPTADMFISTDCLSHKLEDSWKAGHMQPRCGHIPGNGWGRAFNTGIFAVRNREAGKLLLTRWRDLLLDPQKSTTVTNSNATLGITDQLALNMIFDAAIPPGGVHAAPEDNHVLLLSWDAGDTLRLQPLPVLLFASGHVGFVQRLPWRHQVQPLVVHATFQRYPVSQHQVGKRARFREMDMWFLDGTEYYDPPGARYLTYTHDVRSAVEEAAASPRFNGLMPALYKHLVAASYQLAAYRDALAAARMLNRTLVLPTSWCWCDFDWTPHVLERCKIRGSDLQLPFECPADFLFSLPRMEESGVDYRVAGFLDNLQVPEAVRERKVNMQVLPYHLPPDRQPPLAALWLRMKQAQVMAAFQPFKDAPTVTIRGLRPGLLEGFTDASEQRAFDKLYTDTTRELYWCCGAHAIRGVPNSFAYELPRPFSAGYQEWRAPVLQQPTYCTNVGRENQEFLAYANHPCQFLHNSTAAALAAALV
ncbi:hypothetical protein D9Q98_002822 [Chlorella vulgaris]|uniref:Nucleotide-diphospho-sugar transferase domain-containing protein n=1 Tax=Chlorella vulgaris TaxID=3077 RepID=A0A9D4TU38_CHLVU|nr:hypothetical protein D9Q98_002822 [Chlorella vulgaris]